MILSLLGKRGALRAALPAALLLTAAFGLSDPAHARRPAHRAAGDKPTVVLVHGAWADASSWNGEIARLQRAGYPVPAPAVPLRGLATDAAYMASVIETVPGPVVLVSHSYGGRRGDQCRDRAAQRQGVGLRRWLRPR